MTTSISHTICPVCKKSVPCFLAHEDGVCLFVSSCEEHGVFKQIVSQHFDAYKDYENFYFNILGKHRQVCKKDGYALFITDRCNMSCPYCYVDYHHNRFAMLSLDEIKEWLVSNKSNRILLSGGEPSIHPQIIEIIAFAKKNRLNIQMLSNGVKLNDADFCKKLVDAGLGEVNISTESFTEDIAARLNLEKQSLLKQQAIRNMTKLRINITLSPTIFKGMNESHIKECMLLAKDNPCIKTLSFNGFTWGGGGKELSKEQMIMPDEMMDYLFKAVPVGNRNDVYVFNKLFVFLAFLLRQNYCITRQIMFYIRDKKKGLLPITFFMNIAKMEKDLSNIKPLHKKSYLGAWIIFLVLIIKNIPLRTYGKIPLFLKLLFIRVFHLGRFGFSSKLLSVILHTGCSDYYTRKETLGQCICNFSIKTSASANSFLYTTPYKYYVKKEENES